LCADVKDDRATKNRILNKKKVNHFDRWTQTYKLYNNWTASKPTLIVYASVFFIFPTAHFLKQLPTHIAHIAKAPRANAEAKALSKSAILPTRKRDVENFF
jgi:hypothetical protein